MRLVSWSASRDASGATASCARWSARGRRTGHEGTGNGPLAAFADALARGRITVEVRNFAEHAAGPGADAEAVAYAECRVDGVTAWGAGRDTSVPAASVHAVCRR